jgi:hypothetical protein
VLIRERERFRDLSQEDLGNRMPCERTLERSQREASPDYKFGLAEPQVTEAITKEICIRRGRVPANPPWMFDNSLSHSTIPAPDRAARR